MRAVRIIVGLVVGVAVAAGAFAAGIAIQYRHDRPVYAARAAALADARRLTDEGRRLTSQRDAAWRDATDSAAQAAQAQDDLRQIQAEQPDTARVNAEGYVTGLCAAFSLTGTTAETLSEAVRSVDETLWAACQAGIDLAAENMAAQGGSVAQSGSVPQVASVPNLPMPVYGGIICSDGWVSHAAHRQGACSWHGGISP